MKIKLDAYLNLPAGELEIPGTGHSQADLDIWLTNNPSPKITIIGQKGTFTPRGQDTRNLGTAPTPNAASTPASEPINGIDNPKRKYPTRENINNALNGALVWGTTPGELKAAWDLLNDRDAQITGLNAALDDLRASKSRLLQDNLARDGLLFEQRNAADDQARIIKRLENENETLKAEESREVTVLREQFAMVAKANAEKAQQISSQSLAIKRLEKEIDRLEEAMKHGAKMAGEAAGVSHDAQERRIRSLERANDAKVRRIEGLCNQLDRYKERLGAKDNAANDFRHFVDGINRLVNGQQAVSVDVPPTGLLGKAEALLGEYIEAKESRIGHLRSQVADLDGQLKAVKRFGGPGANDHAHINKMASARLAELRQANKNQSLEIANLKSVVAMLINPPAVSAMDDENRYEDDHK